MEARSPDKIEEELRRWFASGQVATWRKQARVTQRTAAQLIGVSHGTYNKWEKQVRFPQGLARSLAYDVIDKWRRAWQRQHPAPTTDSATSPANPE